MKPICVKCQLFYQPQRIGVSLLEQMPDADRSGVIDGIHWHPYKLWMGDQWRCDGCGSEIIVGVGMKPLAEHFEDNFAAELEYAGGDSVLRVNDCRGHHDPHAQAIPRLLRPRH